MKKIVCILALLLALLLAVTACGKKADKKEAPAEQESVAADEETSEEGASDEAAASGQELAIAEGSGMAVEKIDDVSYLIFTVNKNAVLESDAWIGFVPSGKIYKTEEEADEVDVAYTYCEDLEAGKKNGYRFPFELEWISGIEDGRYDLVLCTSDDAAVGKVILQQGIEKKGSEFTLVEE